MNRMEQRTNCRICKQWRQERSLGKRRFAQRMSQEPARASFVERVRKADSCSSFRGGRGCPRFTSRRLPSPFPGSFHLLATSSPGPTLPPPTGEPTVGSSWLSTMMRVHVSRDAGTCGVPSDGKPPRFCLECTCTARANPRSVLLPAFFLSSVQVLPVIVLPASARLVVCRRDQQHMRDHFRPFPAQTDMAHRQGKQATEPTAPCCRKHRLEEEAVTVLKVLARDHAARWACSPSKEEQAVRRTLFPSLRAYQGRLRKPTVAPLSGHKSAALRTMTGLWTMTLLAVHSASAHEA